MVGPSEPEEGKGAILLPSDFGGRGTLFGKQAKSSESLLNLRGLGKWLFWAKTRLLAVP